MSEWLISGNRCLLLGFLALATACSSSHDEGAEAFAIGDYEYAYEKFLEDELDSKGGNRFLALAASQSPQLSSEGVSNLTRLRFDSAADRSLKEYTLGTAALLNQEYETAVTHLRRAVTASRTNSRALTNLTISLALRDNPDQKKKKQEPQQGDDQQDNEALKKYLENAPEKTPEKKKGKGKAGVRFDW